MPVALMVISASELSLSPTRVLVAGHVVPSRMIKGMTVQMISTMAFWWNCPALFPTDLR